MTLRLVVALAIGFAGCAAPPAQPRPATLQLTPCTIDRVPAARCGSLERVADSRNHPAGCNGLYDSASRLWPKSRHIVLKGVAHSLAGGLECASSLMSAFFTAGAADGLDTTCASTTARPPFRP